MADDVRPVEPPVGEQLGEELVLDTGRDVPPVAHLRLPIAEQVEAEDLVLLGKVPGDPVPHVIAADQRIVQGAIEDRYPIAGPGTIRTRATPYHPNTTAVAVP